ncbi:MAG: hypothetical protein DRN14_05410 [Thermoplasmata archaeon]|nr:MAG: hypothetical protein DRN14_05410 [Thermoplasmata archaeon]
MQHEDVKQLLSGVINATLHKKSCHTNGAIMTVNRKTLKSKLDMLLTTYELEDLADSWTQEELIIRGSLGVDTFPEWFNKSSCVYTYKVVQHLAMFYTDYFDIWWDPEKVPVSEYGGILCQYCSKHFKKWWNAEEFPYEQACDALLYCWEYKKIWWDNNPHFQPTEDFYRQLITFFNRHFNSWWNPDLFYQRGGLEYLDLFAQYCTRHFDKWWIPERFKRKLYDFELEALINHCPEHFDKWKFAVPETIVREGFIEWFIDNYPDFCKNLNVKIPAELLIKATKSGITFKSYTITSAVKKQFLSSLSVSKFTELERLIQERLDRIKLFLERLTHSGLLSSKTVSVSDFYNTFDWDKHTVVLLRDFGDFFDIWWNPSIFPWQKHSKDLCKYLPDKFLLWWDERLFNRDHMWALLEYCFDYVEVWLPVLLDGEYFRLLLSLDVRTLERLKLMSILRDEHEH